MTDHIMALPDIGEGVVEAELLTWLVDVGDPVSPETPIAEIMTDKATVEICAPVRGVVEELLVAGGSIVTVGTPIVSFGAVELANGPDPTPDGGVTGSNLVAPSAERRPTERSTLPSSAAGEPTRDGVTAALPLAAPTVRQRARQLGIDLRSVRPQRSDGRIVMADLENASRPLVDEPAERVTRVMSVTGFRRLTANRLSAAWAAPHITYVEEVDVTELDSARKWLNRERDGSERLTLLPFIGRAVIRSCQDFPQMNATYSTDDEQVTLHGSVNLGVATQTDRGLMVPVVHDADDLSLDALARGIRGAADEARTGSADRRRLSGSTITISSLGVLGGVMNTPILNAPEVAIVGVNRMRIVPTWIDGAVVPRSMMNLSASFDHRLVDGWEAAQFVQRIKGLLEMPALLTLGWAE